MDDIAIVDVTLRDGHQSLWAERMTTGMMLPIAEQMDGAGFDAIELLSPSHLGKCVVELREDPFERIRMVARAHRQHPVTPQCRRPQPVRDRSARNVSAVLEPDGGERHTPDAHLRFLEQSGAWEARASAAQNAACADHQHHLFDFAAAHRRLLCRMHQDMRWRCRPIASA